MIFIFAKKTRSAICSRIVEVGSIIVSRYGVRALIQVAVALCAFVAIQVPARFLNVTQFGIFSLIAAVNAFVLLLCFQPITDGINRFLKEALHDGHWIEFERIVARLVLRTAAAVCAIYFVVVIVTLCFGFLPPFTSAALICAVLAYFIFSSLGAVAMTYFNAGAEFLWCFFAACAAPIIGTLLILAVAHFATPTAFDVILSQTIAWAFVLGIIWLRRFKRISVPLKDLFEAYRDADTAFTVSFMKYIWTIPPLSLAAYVFMFGDRIMVARFFPLREVGQYSYMFVLTTSVVVSAYGIYATATYLHAVEQLSVMRAPQEQSRLIRSFIWLSLLFPIMFLPLVLLYSLFDQDIVRFLFGPSASVPKGCLPVLLLSAVLNYGAQQISIVGYLLKCQQKFVLPRWAMISVLVASIAVYHPSLYDVAIVVLSVNAFQFLLTCAIVFRLQFKLSHYGVLSV